ncbi:MAG: hypothetical protein JRI57_04980 [Deltaproteobacteria bacterium]|nr:hypothetical protein [Deltaproteobacteria bacterium]MBW1951739.1 hypothetical protein [Deltaproteobacteria bacterium]MBW1986864.1 hypothetical protein [Deltaproteobacteria bacterium]MBW2134989.1 hypothetical protein [Deltaproteobacteria bacterium]
MRVYRILWLALAVLFICGALGCKSRTPYTGKYVAEVKKPSPKQIFLELKADGEGSWTIESQEVSFRWEVKNGDIWLHTKGGGVIIGTPVGEKLFLDLSGDIRPGGKRLEFKRLPEGG